MADSPKPKRLTLEEALGRIFQQLRESRGLKQIEVAVATGYSLRAIRNTERGEKSPTLRTMEDLATFYKVPLEDLIIRAKKLRDDSSPQTDL
jgi:transcriptional regulator with XRE-family HTH domain